MDQINGFNWTPQRLLGATFIAWICLIAKASWAQVSDAELLTPKASSNHALIITVSGYQQQPLPGVLVDRRLATEIASRFGVPDVNIQYLSEREVTRDGLRQRLRELNEKIAKGDRLLVYFSGHGSRSKASPNSAQSCVESLVMQDMTLLRNDEFASLLKPISSKTDKTMVVLDSCHSGGVGEVTAARSASTTNDVSVKFIKGASDEDCHKATNVRGFTQARGADFGNSNNNLVVLAAARANEVAWDTSVGGAMTSNFLACVKGDARDLDGSGRISMEELRACTQTKITRSQKEQERQHLTLSGNPDLTPLMASVPAAALTAPIAGTTTSAPVAAPQPSPMAALIDIYAQRDDRWDLDVQTAKSRLVIGKDLLDITVRSAKDGHVYIFYKGTRADSFYLLFPNQKDRNNTIRANETMRLPRPDWGIMALGPSGTNNLLVMVSETPRDFSGFSLPPQYTSQVGPFNKIQTSGQALSAVSRISTLSSALKDAECRTGGARDLGIVTRCSSVFGAKMLAVEEVQ